MGETIRSRIWRLVADECAKGDVVDVAALANAVHSFCPELTVKELAEIVLSEVANAHGNALWGEPPLPASGPTGTQVNVEGDERD